MHTSHTRLGSRTSAHLPSNAEPTGGVAFDRTVVLLSIWVLLGLYLDGWAHITRPELETFFTPWHAVLYSGFAVLAAALLAAPVINRRRGATWTDAVPKGYELSLIGIPLFFLGAVGDMTWHMLFGVEESIDALLSPTHLLLAFSGALIGGGPLRAAWRRRTPGGVRSWSDLWPMISSLILLLSLFGFFTMYAHPFGRTLAARSPGPQMLAMPDQFMGVILALGVSSILLQTVLQMGMLLLVLYRWPQLPTGAIAAILTIPVALIAAMRAGVLATGPWAMIGAALLAGIAAEALFATIRPSRERRSAFRLFAFAVPAVLYGFYFLAIHFFGGGIWWSIHFWTGAVALAGLAGWLASYLVLTPLLPEQQ